MEGNGDVNWKKLRLIHPERFLLRLGLLILLLVAALYVAMVNTGPARFLGQLLIGVFLAHAVELAHQCLHKTATGRGEVDHFIGRLLCLPSGVSFWHYLYFHMWHHKHNGTEQDQESFGYAYERLTSPRRLKRVSGFLWHLSQFAHYQTTGRRMWRAITGRLAGDMKTQAPAMPTRIARLIQQDYQLMAVTLLIGGVVTVAFRTPLLATLWLIPLLVGYSPAHALIELPEHFLCDHPTSDVFVNTRSIRAGRFATWLTNSNCNHIGHHLDPLVPMEKVPDMERLLREQHEFKHLEDSYPAFYCEVARLVWNGLPKQ